MGPQNYSLFACCVVNTFVVTIYLRRSQKWSSGYQSLVLIQTLAWSIHVAVTVTCLDLINRRLLKR